ncbi:MAG TPA: ATP-binding cassette domain-containing protein, partial [Ilumatobacteraceae bacterium]|nr:ATP-binding cassette domain-containing protein [Ilumatobacteraceae bacterium]
MSAALSVRGATKRFGAVLALDDVDLDVHHGEVVALLGDNGAGKSTLIKCISGVHRLDAGSIALD